MKTEALNPERTETKVKTETGICEWCAQGWQTIKTAPKDGTHILLYERDNDSVCEGRYVNSACRWFERNAHPTDAWDGEIYRPTHWMPLPAPPVAGAEG